MRYVRFEVYRGCKIIRPLKADYEFLDNYLIDILAVGDEVINPPWQVFRKPVGYLYLEIHKLHKMTFLKQHGIVALIFICSHSHYAQQDSIDFFCKKRYAKKRDSRLTIGHCKRGQNY